MHLRCQHLLLAGCRTGRILVHMCRSSYLLHLGGSMFPGHPHRFISKLFLRGDSVILVLRCVQAHTLYTPCLRVWWRMCLSMRPASGLSAYGVLTGTRSRWRRQLHSRDAEPVAKLRWDRSKSHAAT